MTELFDISNPGHRAFVPEGTILLACRGSIAHGMYVPSTDPKSIDDVDLMGVVIGSERDYFGLHEWGHRGTREAKEAGMIACFTKYGKCFDSCFRATRM